LQPARFSRGKKLRPLLKSEGGCEIVGEFASAAETVELAGATQPDLVFLDIRMPGLDCFDVIDVHSARTNYIVPSIVVAAAYDQ
jgi:two-component system LytT family response regulator